MASKSQGKSGRSWEPLEEPLRFQAQLLDSVRESVIATDLDGRVVHWSKGAEALYGYEPQEVMGQPITFIVPAGSEDEERERMRQVLETGRWSGQYVQTRKDGSLFWADTVIFLVCDRDGRPRGFVGIDRDVTDRVKAEEALRVSEQRLALVLEVASEGIWDWNIRTGEVYYSPRWKRSLGYADHEVPPHVSFWESLVHPQDMPRVRAALQAHFEGRTPIYECENRLRTRSGAWRWNLDRGRVVERDAEGQPLRMVGADTDLTERKRAEREQRTMERKLRETQKLESLGILAGGIAHDFNNLLTGVLGNAGLVRRELPPGAPVQECLKEIEDAAQRAADLCRELLAYSGKARFRVQRIDLNTLVEETTPLVQSSISKKAALELALSPGLPPVIADPTQLRQIVMNLVINASDALGDEVGSIRMATGLLHADRELLARAAFSAAAEPGEYVLLEVSDSGCGMDEGTRARIFEPFFTTKFTGRGLGLAAVLGIVRGHRGALLVESAPGEGSTFRLLLPRADGAAAGPDATLPASPGWCGRGTALVVDDEPSVRQVAARMLVRLGMQAIVARDGGEALELLDRAGDQVAVVLLDLTMPRLDGEQTWRRLRERRPELPVILMTGYDETEAGERFLDARPAGFLHKPFRLESLRQTLEQALS